MCSKKIEEGKKRKKSAIWSGSANPERVARRTVPRLHPVTPPFSDLFLPRPLFSSGDTSGRAARGQVFVGALHRRWASARYAHSSSSAIGLDKILVARQLTQLVAGSAQLDSARFNFFMSWAGSLARYFNEPARELLTSWNELRLSAHDHESRRWWCWPRIVHLFYLDVILIFSCFIWILIL